MPDFLSAYSIQNWLESCPQGYLEGTEFGHGPGESEPALIRENKELREDAIRATVLLVIGERCALAASSGLINAAPDEASKRFLATQTLDEARHVEVFTQRLFDLGVRRSELEEVIDQYASRHLLRFAEVLLERVDRGDFIAGVVGQNIVLEGLSYSVFEMQHAYSREVNPKFAKTLVGTIADERRHVGFGENRIGSLIRQHPERKADVERMQRDMTYHMLATFAEAFGGPRPGDATREQVEQARREGGSRDSTWRGTNLATAEPADLEAVLSHTVLAEFKMRLGRIGLDYQTPPSPRE